MPPDRLEATVAAAFFALVLGFSVWGVSVGWTSRNLPGNEFRQAQTAVSALFIQRDHDFSLAYPTPVLGKPWSVPLEFPLYQWTVVVLSDATGLELTKAGRLVSIVCFYLTLPFLYLLLGRLGLPGPRRLVALSPVVVCPLYIFFARSFLMETMALCFGVLFLWSYLHAVERRRVGWLVLAAVAGTGAGLVKVTTFLFILAPAFGWTIFHLWSLRPGTGNESWRDSAVAAGWALAAVSLPCVASYWWIGKADAIKALNPTANFLRAETMNSYLFGYGFRFSGEIWRQHLFILFREIASGWVLAGAGVLALVFARRWWGWIALLVGAFFAVQLVHPLLYAWHNYYYVANAFTLMLAIGLALGGVLESRLPRALAWALVVAMTAGQIGAYLQTQYPEQRGFSPGGTGLTRTLRAVTDPDDVLVIAGNDWSPITPFFAQRRALMIRNGLEWDEAYLRPAFRSLQGERVGALVLHGRQRENRLLLDLAVHSFNLDPRPVYTMDEVAVYMHPLRRRGAIPVLNEMSKETPLELEPEAMQEDSPLVQHEVETDMLRAADRGLFAGMSPTPWKFYSNFGAGRPVHDGKEYYDAHPITRLWFKAPAGRRQISVEVGLIPEAYDESVPWGDRTDGIEVVVYEEPPGQPLRPLFSRVLDPRGQPTDRGIQRLECSAEFATDTVVQIAVLPGPSGSLARDWTVIDHVVIK